MKTLKQITFAIVTLLFLNSCDEVDKLTEVDIDTVLTKEITFTVNETGDFNETLSINLAEYNDISDYLNKIENIKINAAAYKVTAFPESIIVGGTVTVNAANQTFGSFIHENFKDDFDNQTIYPLNGANKLNAIANLLEDTNQLQVNFSGSAQVNEAFTMTLKVSFDVTVTAQAL